MADQPFVIVRADASPEIGLGHLMRSRTLALALADEGARVEFRGAGIPVAPPVDPAGRISVVPTAVAHESGDATAIIGLRPDVVVVDGYHFAREFFDALHAASVPHVVVDDNGETSATAPAAVLNQQPHADAALYAHLRGQPKLLLGLDYLLVRPEIRALARSAPRRQPDRVFVAMGGSDPRQMTFAVVEKVATSDRQVRVAVGPSVADRDALVARIGQLERAEVISPGNYATELATCGLAVLAAGSSLWEAAVLGTPVVAIIVADNQRASAIAADEMGLLVGRVDAIATGAAVAPNVSAKVSAAVNEYHKGGTRPDGRRKLTTSGAERAARELLCEILDSPNSNRGGRTATLGRRGPSGHTPSRDA